MASSKLSWGEKGECTRSWRRGSGSIGSRSGQCSASLPRPGSWVWVLWKYPSWTPGPPGSRPAWGRHTPGAAGCSRRWLARRPDCLSCSRRRVLGKSSRRKPSLTGFTWGLGDITGQVSWVNPEQSREHSGVTRDPSWSWWCLLVFTIQVDKYPRLVCYLISTMIFQ